MKNPSEQNGQMRTIKPIRYLDLFAGIGGFRAGLERVGGFECIGHCETDKFANRSYQAIHNIKESEVFYDDVKNINPKQLPNFDLLTAGFPCQAFSMAGKRQGFKDPRGTLFFDIARIAREKKPAYLLLENVPGLLSHDRGRTFAAILGTLCKLGYGVEWQIHNSKDYGVPQNRRRVYLVCYLDKRCRGKIFPFRKQDEQTHLYTAERTDTGRTDTKQTNIDPRTAPSGLNDGGRGLKIRSSCQAGYVTAIPGDSINLGYIGSTARRTRVGKQIASTLTTSPLVGVVTDDLRIRKLTPREYLRLQGFDEVQINRLLAVTSDHQAYRQAGNAVTVNVVAAIGKRLLAVHNSLNETERTGAAIGA
jgi:DNA (cytosine-5)-methyltransferase 1